jgi:hypothetical protein
LQNEFISNFCEISSHVHLAGVDLEDTLSLTNTHSHTRTLTHSHTRTLTFILREWIWRMRARASSVGCGNSIFLLDGVEFRF